MRNESGWPASAARSRPRKTARHDADERRQHDRDQRGHDRAVDHRQRAELTVDRIPTAVQDESRAEPDDGRPRAEHELDEQPDDEEREESASAVDDRGKAAVGGAYEARNAPKLRARVILSVSKGNQCCIWRRVAAAASCTLRGSGT